MASQEQARKLMMTQIYPLGETLRVDKIHSNSLALLCLVPFEKSLSCFPRRSKRSELGERRVGRRKWALSSEVSPLHNSNRSHPRSASSRPSNPHNVHMHCARYMQTDPGSKARDESDALLRGSPANVEVSLRTGCLQKPPNHWVHCLWSSSGLVIMKLEVLTEDHMNRSRTDANFTF